MGKGEVLWNETRTVNSQTLTDHFISSREYRERRGVCTRAPTCHLVTTLSPSLWCYLPTFPLRIFTFRVLLNNRETSCPDNLSLTQEVTDLLMSGQPSPSTASSSKVLRVVTSDFQNFHLTANKVCDWMKILLSKYYTEETKPFNLYLFKKIISGSL